MANAKPLKSVYFDLGGWHRGAACNLVFVSGSGGIGVKVCCTNCGCVADVEALGVRVSAEESAKEKTIT